MVPSVLKLRAPATGLDRKVEGMTSFSEIRTVAGQLNEQSSIGGVR